MSNFNLYFLTHQSKVFSTYANKNVVIGSRSIDTIHALRKFLHLHNLKYGRWVNQYENLSFMDEYDSELTLTTNTCFSSHLLTISSVNLSHTCHLPGSSFVMDILMKHSDVFIVDEFEYNRVNDILSLQGLCFQSDNFFEDENVMDNRLDYLNGCYNSNLKY
jgi:hypothetical protein